MSRLWFLFLVIAPVYLFSPQGTAPEGYKYWPVSVLSQNTQVLTQKSMSDPHHFATQQLGDFPNESVLLVHRVADGQAELHETQVDVVFVQSGSATLVVGGKIVNGETIAPHEIRNGTIEGATRQKLVAGDVLRIPPNTPHQLLLEGSKEITYMVVKVKGY